VLILLIGMGSGAGSFAIFAAIPPRLIAYQNCQHSVS
jgi:hypothetical protein